jgi:hypothetical protein
MCGWIRINIKTGYIDTYTTRGDGGAEIISGEGDGEWRKVEEVVGGMSFFFSKGEFCILFLRLSNLKATP